MDLKDLTNTQLLQLAHIVVYEDKKIAANKLLKIVEELFVRCVIND